MADGQQGGRKLREATALQCQVLQRGKRAEAVWVHVGGAGSAVGEGSQHQPREAADGAEGGSCREVGQRLVPEKV